ncbi:glycogen debranching protein GlgX [Antrihabitans sp. NCIMB 15449]|uniref:Glycogen debranching protein GlgX n=1 Tax=Antrihabitans spumae TaxID=3373370 RepID=A0ABW7JNU5_9NOCA
MQRYATDPLPAGSPYPLGATLTRTGTHFAVHAPDAERVQVCLVDDGAETRIDLPHQTYGIWHGTVDGVRAGQQYGYRAYGEWNPRRGRRMNPRKFLLDPAARRIDGRLGDATALLGYAGDDPFGDPSLVNSFAHMPRSVVGVEPGPVTDHLETPWADTVIYELHVGSFTARHPDVPPEHRGRYLGLAAEPILDHLRRIGVTAVELLPVHAFLSEPSVRSRGLRNHWGYSTASYFAVHPGYATAPGREIDEFATMTAALHAAGIEVVLDVVYNHTCEASIAGPTVSWRGLDAPGYYQLDADGRDIDITGCGNTIDAYSPAVVAMICDSLRYFYGRLGVDGFRFDLASALGRTAGGPFDSRAPLLSSIVADPMLQRAKLIAEPWDATAAGYQAGNFGLQWSEWNDKFRDDVRRFWNGDQNVRELASRLAGSEKLYGRNRRPWASVNFVTAHDGCSLADLVSYENKHNEANGEYGRDGTEHNFSTNHGVEGPSDDPDVVAARSRHMRALLATLLLSTGTPMLLAGDEIGHTQGGNNNAYCVAADAPLQDSWPIVWTGGNDELAEYVSRLGALRRSAPALRQAEFFSGRDTPTGHPDLVWFGIDGRELDNDAWHDDSRRTLQAWIDVSDVRSTADRVNLDETSWLLVLHAGPAASISLGAPEWFDGTLEPAFDSSDSLGRPREKLGIESDAVVETTGPTVLAYRARPRTR